MKKILLILSLISQCIAFGQNKWQWAIFPDSTTNIDSHVSQMTNGINGDIIVFGYFQKQLTLKNYTLQATAGGAFLASLSDKGSINWLQKPPGGSPCVDKAGNIYLLCGFTNSIVLGSNTNTIPAGAAGYYVAKFTPAGQIIWSKYVGHGLVNRVMMVSSNNDIYIGGSYNTGTVTPLSFGTFSIAPVTPTSTNMFVAKLDTSGTVTDLNTIGQNGTAWVTSIAANQKGEVILSAMYSGTFTIGSTTLTGGTGNKFSNLIVNVNGAGNVKWVKSIQQSGGDLNVKTNSAGDVCIAGLYNSPGVVLDNFSLTPTSQGPHGLAALLDSSGNVKWLKSIGMIINSCSITNKGNVLLAGFHDLPVLTVNNYTLASTGGEDLFVAELDPNGNAVRLFGAGGPGTWTPAFALLEGPGNDVIVGGGYMGPGVSFGTHKDVAGRKSGDYTMFIANYGNGNFTAVGDLRNEGISTIYPVPARTHLTVESKVPLRSITVYDIAMNKVEEISCSSSMVKITIEGFPDGVYFIEARAEDGGRSVTKIIKCE